VTRHASGASGERRSGTAGRAIAAIVRKEFIEGLRDRQTVMYTFLLPIALYPVLFWVMVQGVLLVRGQKDATNVRVLLVAPSEPGSGAAGGGVLEVGAVTTAGLREALEHASLDDTIAAEPVAGEQPEPAEDSRPKVGQVEVETLATSSGTRESDSDDALWPTAEESAVTELATARLAADDDLAAIVVVPRAPNADGPITIYHDGTRSRSSIARERIAARLELYAEKLRTERAAARDVPVAALEPIEVRTRGLATSAQEGALALSLMLPMLLIVMAVMGSFFPAVDLTAGEKERRTAETTLLLPVPRTAVHLGKILAVTIAGMIATTLNLLALGLSAGHLLGQLGADVEIDLPVGALLAIAPLAFLFVFFVSAVLTGVAGLAASFKEGQALLGPVQMIFIFPAMAASLPGLHLTYATALVPIVNVALAFRELLIGHAELGPVLLTAAALLVYALLALRLSVRVLASEGVALAGKTIPIKRLIALLKGRGNV